MKHSKFIKGNETTIDPNDKVTPLYNETFPATAFKKTQNGKIKSKDTSKNADRLRNFSIENKK